MHTWVAAAGVIVGSFLPASAHAQESTAGAADQQEQEFKLDDYCERVREAGQSAAAVLLGPRVGVQVIKFPAEGDLTLAAQTTGSETQFRSYAQYSLTDAYRGTLMLKLGDAECRRQRLAQPLEDAIRLGTDQGRRDALSLKLRFLRENDEAVAAAESDAEARHRAEVGTVVELIEIQTLASAFRAQEAETEDEIARLTASALAEPTAPLSRQASEYERASMDTEELGARIRQVAPWGLSLSGGVAVTAAVPADWFGTVDLSYNFGDLVQGPAEHRLLAARQRELESASYELPAAARAVDTALNQSVAQLKRQTSVVEKEVEDLRAEESLVETSDAPGRLTLISVVKLRRIVAQAQLVYLQALADKRQRWASLP
jgi:hypothetical protein